ncbi:MAG: heparinase II/III family protein [Planctomycetes bacterium]|nr:heparinase II/III family protein [Planctomycetota bacterium]MCL4730480.1 heparinase II/III family protein [Planctomycetota bacterium]
MPRLILAIALVLLCFAPSGAQRQKSKDPEIPKPAPAIKAGAWAEVLKGNQVRTLGPAAWLKQRAKDYPELYRRVQSCAGDTLQAAGIVHAVDGLPADKIRPFLDQARADAKRGATNVHQDTWVWMQRVALCFDYFRDQVTEDDRKQFIEFLNANFDSFTDDENAFHNSTMTKILVYLQVAYATWTENPRAKEFRDKALGFLYEKRVMPVLLEFGRGGGGTECGWYLKGALWALCQGLELARRVEGYDGFAKADRFFYQRLAYECFQWYPGRHKDYYGAERFPLEGDAAAGYGGHSEYPMNTRALLAAYFKGSELARAVANFRRRGGNPQSDMQLFLWDDKPDDPLPPDQLPLAHAALGIGKVFARSGWGDDATWFRFECSDYYCAHQHFDAGNFEIFRHESLATESGEYHDWGSPHAMNWLVRTIAHNCILVHDPSETWAQMRDGGRVAYANDGGQAKKWQWTVQDLDTWKQRRSEFERGDIVAWANTDAALFVAADVTAAYAPKKLKLWTRQIVYIRPGLFVILDRVKSTRADFAKTWLLHCRNEPALKDNTFAIKDGAGELHGLCLLPADAKLAAVHGYTYGGQTFDPPQTGHSQYACKWRVETTPGKAATDDVFLHVLSTDGPVDAEVKESGGKVTVKVSKPARAEITFGNDIGATVKAGKTLEFKREILAGRYE